jgi:hypothetical protein
MFLEIRRGLNQMKTNVLQGGAQGMMMELVGLSLAKALLQTESVQLVAIQVDFQSSGRDVVEVTATEINHGGVHNNGGDGDDDDDVITACQLAVRIVEKKTGRIVSTGNLWFVKASSSSSTAASTPPRRRPRQQQQQQQPRHSTRRQRRPNTVATVVCR